MTKPNALAELSHSDCATCGPVRAGLTKKPFPIGRIALTALLAVPLFLRADFGVAASRGKAPALPVVIQAVEMSFASLPDYREGDLITRSQIERVLAKLNDAGAQVPNTDKIAERGLDDESFIVRELSTPSGRGFMRRLARNPSTFARLDRLSMGPRGESVIRDLIRQKDGDKMIEYLATTKGGQKTGSMMAAAPGGADLNKPTGRIYTVADLIEAIKGAYAAPSH
jgi:hypothetical protein